MSAPLNKRRTGKVIDLYTLNGRKPLTDDPPAFEFDPIKISWPIPSLIKMFPVSMVYN
jgi:hypothetical protein